MKLRSSFVFAISLAFVLHYSASAFDGVRKGFIIGFGAGGGLTTFTQKVSSSPSYYYTGGEYTSERENKGALMTDFKIGYNANSQLDIYYGSKVSWFQIKNIYNDNVIVANGLGGVGVTYFFKPESPSFFVCGLIGYSAWSLPFESGVDTWYGFGISGGSGYEFSRHCSFGLDINWGKPSKTVQGVKVSSNALTIKATFNVMAY